MVPPRSASFAGLWREKACNFSAFCPEIEKVAAGLQLPATLCCRRGFCFFETDRMRSSPRPLSERRAILSDGRVDQCLDLGPRKRPGGIQTDEPILNAGALQNSLRIRQCRSPIERQSHSVRRRGDRDDRIRRPLGRAVADDEKIVVVPDELIGRREPATQSPPDGPDQRLVFQVELGDERRELLLGLFSRVLAEDDVELRLPRLSAVGRRLGGLAHLRALRDPHGAPGARRPPPPAPSP